MKSNMVINLLIGAAVGFVGGYIVRKQLTKMKHIMRVEILIGHYFKKLREKFKL